MGKTAAGSGLAGLGSMAEPGFAQGLQLTDGVAQVVIELDGQQITIARDQDPVAPVSGEIAALSRACPPFCLQPQIAIRGVETVAELEVIAFLQQKVAKDQGALLDARLPEAFDAGSIPGAVNVPFVAMSPDNPYHRDLLLAFGVTPLGGGFDFCQALDLTVFCHGIWSDQAVQVLRALRGVGYPAEKLHYYRGGMQDWRSLGLTVVQLDLAAPP